MITEANNRVLIVDDNPAIHEDFAKIFSKSLERESFAAFDQMLFDAAPTETLAVEVSSAYQGHEGLEAVVAARVAMTPFAIAFVDVRMPPGWDGVETTVRILKADPEIQIVLCSAYSDHSWEDIRRQIGDTDRVLFLRKPFDAIEAQQLAAALQRKWRLASQCAQQMKMLEALVDDRTQELELAQEKLRLDFVTRLREEKELRHTQRLESLGRLTAGVGHEINNPLSYVMANVSFAREVIQEIAETGSITPAQTEDLADLLRTCESGGERIRNIVTAIGTFSRGENSQLTSVCVDTAVTNAALLARNQIEHQAELVFDLDAACMVRTGQESLEQVIINLLINAQHAVKDCERRNICVRTRVLPGDQVAIEVSDTGVGIPEENLERVFDPFFTTRTVGDGTGLGLALCHELVSQFSGSIQLESKVGAGTTVRVVLPLAHSQVTAGPPPLARQATAPEATRHVAGRCQSPTDTAVDSRPRILIVDDDRFVRVSMGRLLSEFTVFLTESVAEALDVYAHNEIDLILSDLMMPKGGGDLLYTELEKLGGEHCQRILFMTGGVFDPKMQAFLDKTRRPQVAKPIQANTLKQLVHDQLKLVGPACRVARSDSAPKASAQARAVHGREEVAFSALS